MQLATRFASNASSIRSATTLSDEQIRRVAPSVFAEAAHDSRSSRYTYVPTARVLDGLRAEGFLPVMATQSRSRDASRREFTKHMLRLRRSTGPAVVGEELPEIVLVNSHDGTSAYQMLAGIFRLVCSNGMVVGAGRATEIRVPHQGDIVGRVIEGAYSVVEDFDRVRESAESMKALPLLTGEQRMFAQAALVAKYGEETPAISVDQVLTPNRSEDLGNDLWRTFNRVQENLVRGGLRTRSANGRRMRTREVAGISQNVQLNRALWTLAEEMKKLKA